MNLTPTSIGRRTLLQRTGFGLGAFALSQMLQQDASGATATPENPLAPKVAHFPAKAKSVIYLHMVGAPSHLDLFDYKPTLQKRSGEDCPKDLFESGKFAFVRNLPKLLGTPADAKYNFKRCGQSGLEIFQLAAEPADGGRRDDCDQIAAHRPIQSWSRADVFVIRFFAVRQAQHRFLAELRARHRESGSAWVCCFDHRQCPGRGQPGLGQRFSFLRCIRVLNFAARVTRFCF